MWKWTCMLQLQNKKIGIYGIMWLIVIPQLKSLTYINLRGNQISDEGLRMFTMYDWKILQYLNLSNNQISCRGLVKMFSANWPQLNKIDLSKTNFYSCENKIGQEGLRMISKLRINKLNYLNLSYCCLKEQVQFFVASWFYFSKMCQLNLQQQHNAGEQISRQGYTISALLFNGFKNLQIVRITNGNKYIKSDILIR